MGLINILLVLVAGMNFSLALLVWFRNYRDRINIYLGLSIFLFGLWSLFEAIVRMSPDRDSALMLAEVENFIGFLIPFIFLIFAHYFPYRSFKVASWQIVGLILCLLILIAIVFSHNLVTDIIYEPGQTNYGLSRIGMGIFTIFFTFNAVFSFYLLYQKLINNQNIFRKNILMIIYATGFTGLFSTIFGAVIPVITAHNNPWFTPLFSLPMIIILTGYILKANKA